MTIASWHVKGSISPRQIKAIHAGVNKLGLDDDAYRAMLRGRYGAGSCKDLTWRQAEELLDHLNGRSPSPPRERSRGEGARPYQDMDGRPGYASGAQCRLIAGMFAQVSRADEADREKALNSFCNRIAHVAGLRMVKGYQVEKIVKALESMGAVHKGRG